MDELILNAQSPKLEIDAPGNSDLCMQGVSLKGDKGDKGDPGEKPVKGVDYWTEADKAEVVGDVKKELQPELDSKVDKAAGYSLSAVADAQITDEGYYDAATGLYDDYTTITISKTDGTQEKVSLYDRDKVNRKLANLAELISKMKFIGYIGDGESVLNSELKPGIYEVDYAAKDYPNAPATGGMLIVFPLVADETTEQSTRLFISGILSGSQGSGIVFAMEMYHGIGNDAWDVSEWFDIGMQNEISGLIDAVEGLRENKANSGVLENVDVKTITQTGIYQVGSGCTGLPEDLPYYFCGATLVVSEHSGEPFPGCNQYLIINDYDDDGDGISQLKSRIYVCQIYGSGYDMPWTVVVDGAWGDIIDELQNTKADIAELLRVEAIAKGRATGYVFDTVADMQAWVSDSDNASQLNLGDNLYIRAVDVPDYWWDGEQPQQLETQKVDLSGYVKNTDYATAAKAGILRPSTSYGTSTIGDGYLRVQKASIEDINAKTHNFRTIVPSNLDYAVKSVTVNEIVENEDAPVSSSAVYRMGYVKDTDYATYEKHGIVKASGSFGVGVNAQGIMTVRKATDAQIDAGTDGYAPIVPSNLDHAVKSVTVNEIVENEDAPVSSSAVYRMGYVKDTDYATYEKHGVVKASRSFGIGVNTQGIMTIRKALDATIDAGTDNYAPIVSSNVRHAVKVHTDTEITADGEMPVSGSAVYEQIAKITPKGSATGTDIAVNDHLADAPLIDYKAYGNSVQETRSGKNLFNNAIDNVSRVYKFTTYTEENGIYTITASGTGGGIFFNCELLPGDYYFSAAASPGTVFIQNAEGTTIYRIGTVAKTAFTIEEKGAIIAIYTDNTDTFTMDLSNMQIETGTAATDYEPYGATPSPEYPSEIQSVGDLVTDGEHSGKYAIPVAVQGKNLFLYLKPNGVNCTIIESIANGAIVEGNASAATPYYSYSRGWFYSGNRPENGNGVKLMEGQTVTVSADITLMALGTGGAEQNAVGMWLSSREHGNAVSTSSKLENLEINKTVKIIVIYSVPELYSGDTFYPCIALNSNKLKIENIQIEYGVSATEYEPYMPPQTYSVYADAPLRKVGDYADYVDFGNQQIVRNIKHLPLTSDMYWNDTYANVLYTNLAASNSVKSDSGSTLLLHTNYSPAKIGWFSTTNTSGTAIGFRLADGNWPFTNKSELMEWLDNHNMYTEYPLATPTYEPIALPPVTLPETARVHIDTDTTVKGNLDIRYYQDINKKLAELQNVITEIGGI